MAGGGFTDSYYYFLKYTMKEGILMGLYMFMTGMGFISEEADVKDKVQFLSQWIWGSWADDEYYYKVSKIIWVFGFDEEVGVCYDANSNYSSECYALKYYWMFIMTLNVFLTMPLSHAAAVYTWGADWYDKFDTILGWL